MLLLRRFLPYLIGLITAGLLALQSTNASSYPWFAVVSFVLFCMAAVCIVWRRMAWADLMSKSLPTMLLIASSGYGLLLAEGMLATIAIPLVAGVFSFVTLELLFLITFLPTRYPVNGLSRLNVSLVPITLWLAASTSVGLTMFVHASRSIPILVMAGATAMLFWSTSYVDATPEHRRRWMAIGGALGAQLGLMGALLPFNIALHGTLAALLGALALRTRRYGIMPHLPKQQVAAELVTTVVMLVAVLSTARWV